MAALSNGKMPPASLTRFDAGLYPVDLEPLTYLETLLVSPLRPYRNVFVMRGGNNSWRSSDTLMKAMRGHVVAFENPDPSSLGLVFPLHPDNIPEVIQVVLLGSAATKEELHQKLSASPALTVNGPRVAKWIVHLREVYKDKPFARVDDAIINIYAGMRGVPQALLDNAIHAPSEEMAEKAERAFMQEREGYCGQRYGSAEEREVSRTTAGGGNAAVMAGLDAIEIEGVGPQTIDLQRTLASSARGVTAEALLRNGGKLVVKTGSQMYSDYQGEWFLMVHPTAFPNGIGQCPPKGMALSVWCKYTLRRFPREQFGGNCHLVLDMFNVLQRHAVSLSRNFGDVSLDLTNQ